MAVESIEEKDERMKLMENRNKKYLVLIAYNFRLICILLDYY